VNCTVYELAIELQLRVVMICKCSINPTANQKIMALMKAGLEEVKSVADHQQVPKRRDRIENYRSTGRPIRGPASSRGATPTAEETDPGLRCVPEEVGRSP
jgi:hypothetical protein